MSLAKPTPYGNAEDLAMINRSLVAQLRKGRATIQRIRALHEHRAPEPPYVDYCEHCGADWPCVTVRMLDRGE